MTSTCWNPGQLEGEGKAKDRKKNWNWNPRAKRFCASSRIPRVQCQLHNFTTASSPAPPPPAPAGTSVSPLKHCVDNAQSTRVIVCRAQSARELACEWPSRTYIIALCITTLAVAPVSCSSVATLKTATTKLRAVGFFASRPKSCQSGSRGKGHMSLLFSQHHLQGRKLPFHFLPIMPRASSHISESSWPRSCLSRTVIDATKDPCEIPAQVEPYRANREVNAEGERAGLGLRRGEGKESGFADG